MKPRTQEFLYLLLWGADQLARPTFRNLTDSFESWAHQKGLPRHLRDLAARGLVERQPSDAADTIYRLSERGRLVALGGRDPVAQWSRPWDGQWRMVLFDLPQAKATARNRFRRFLKRSRFGWLQNSVWLTPDPLHQLVGQLAIEAGEVESLLTFEGRPASGESDADMVAGAWDFNRINRGYEQCLKVLEAFPTREAANAKSSPRLQRWAALERNAWQAAADLDPFLPEALLPKGYLGKPVWQARLRVLGRAGHSIR